MVHGIVGGWRIGNRAAYSRLEPAAGPPQSRGGRSAATLARSDRAGIRPLSADCQPADGAGGAVKALQSGELVQIGVFATDEEREHTLLAIHVPLAKGLLGWRVCLIRQGDEGRFANIRSLADWQQAGLRIGQHRSWPDTRLLKENGLNVVVGSLYDALFNMLRKQRFDCFLRSVIEIEEELKQHPELAKRIELGLQRARQSGDYERVFEAGFGSTIRRLQLDRRVMLELSNPDLPAGSRAMMQDPSLIYVPALPAVSAQ